MRKELNRLRSDSYKYRAFPDHPSYSKLRKQSNTTYSKAILHMKRQYWVSYLEDMTTSDIWTANKYLKEPAGNGGNPRIPTLWAKDKRGREVEVNDSHDKARLFANTFFPPPPLNLSVQTNFDYPEPIPDPPQITKAQIEAQIRCLSLFKASSPDGIPNVVL